MYTMMTDSADFNPSGLSHDIHLKRSALRKPAASSVNDSSSLVVFNGAVLILCKFLSAIKRQNKSNNNTIPQ